MNEVKIYIAPIGATSESRREREREAVAQLIRRNLGEDVRVDHRPDGSPVAVGYVGEISISHSRDHVVVATHPRLRIGVDVELPRRQLERIRPKFLSETELCESLDDLLHAWTAKEAVYKAAGTVGLSLTEIEVDRVNKTAMARGHGYQLDYQRHGEELICVAVPIL